MQDIDFICTDRGTGIKMDKGWCYMSIADETAEGLFVGFDGAGEGVNSEEEEARGRAEREAAEREVARVRMRQDLTDSSIPSAASHAARTCLDAAASLPPLWASNDSVLHLLLCEGLCISSFDSLYYATPDLFSFSICRRQWWLSLLDLLCSEAIGFENESRSRLTVDLTCDVSVTLSLFDWQAISFHNKLESLRLFSIDIGITPVSSLLRGYTKLEPLTIAKMSSSSLPSHRISPSYAPVGALGSRWTKAGVTSLSRCVQRSFSGLYHPSLVSCVACNNTNFVGVLR
ncbi:hypothetical protein F2Q69_00004457 [Brassica cretica]|uniref:Uncharacterized protein n=1 Tax=Brassica cretica TaxID=69181 RepID=A0A8S9NTC1_BRACR|nr:hypothetical protein F2Q69_00004457 [Brassica cretica]